MKVFVYRKRDNTKLSEVTDVKAVRILKNAIPQQILIETEEGDFITFPTTEVKTTVYQN